MKLPTIRNILLTTVLSLWAVAAHAQRSIYPTPELDSRTNKKPVRVLDTSMTRLKKEIEKVDKLITKIKKNNFNHLQLKSYLKRKEKQLRFIDFQIKDPIKRGKKRDAILDEIRILKKKLDFVLKVPYLIKNRYDKLNEKIQEFAKHPKSMDYELDIKQIGQFVSKDTTLRMFTWESNLARNKMLYHTIIQTRMKGADTTINYFLHDRGIERISPKETMSDRQWKGIVYYDLIESGGPNEYLLLGWRPSTNGSTQEKIIETLRVTENSIAFGVPIIQKDTQLVKRLNFKYAANVNMSVKYEPAHKTVVIDHLNTFDKEFEGMSEFYGPDFSYDALKWEKDRWRFYEDYNVDSVIIQPKDVLPF